MNSNHYSSGVSSGRQIFPFLPAIFIVLAVAHRLGRVRRQSWPRNRRRFGLPLAIGLIALAVPGTARAQSIPFDLRPVRLDVEVNPGTEKTVGFRVQTGSSEVLSRETLIVEPTDWDIQEDGSVVYAEPGSLRNSASPWVKFSPSAFALIPAMNQLIRITVAVPSNAAPGLYRTGMFVQERAAATTPTFKAPAVILRVRYAFFLFVIVPQAKAQPEFTSFDVDVEGETGHLRYAMKNSGNLHVRPLLRWAIKNDKGELVGEPGEHPSTVLLGQSSLHELFNFPARLPPGHYQMAVMVDFRDGEPLQTMSRSFSVWTK